MAKIPLYVITISLVVGLGSFEFGFGSAVFITSLGQPGFYMYYGLDPTAKREWHWHGMTWLSWKGNIYVVRIDC